MKATSLFPLFYSLVCFFTPLLSKASTVNQLIIIPHQVVGIKDQKPVSEPISIEKNLVLQIDAEKSFIEIREQPPGQLTFSSPPWTTPINPTSYESKKYPISGIIELYDRYYDSETYREELTKITNINIDSGLSNIALDPDFFWVRTQVVRKDHWDKTAICGCITNAFPPDYFSTQKTSFFDGESLSLNGDGNFLLDETSGLYVIQSDSDSTHRIRYHIEANVVSSVPIPASLYLFLSGLGLLARFRLRGH